MTGLNRAMTPGPQVVAVGEAAGQDDRRRRRRASPARATATTGSAPARSSAWTVSRSQLVPGKTTTPIRTLIGQPRPRRRSTRSAPSGSIAYASISGFDSSSPASRSTIARAAASSAASTVSSTRRPTRTPLTPSIAEVAEAALHRPALRVEDAGLGRDVDGEPEAASSGDHVLLRGSARSWRR